MDRFSIARGIDSMEAKVKDLDRQKEAAVMDQDFEKAVHIKEEQDELKKSLYEIKNPLNSGTWVVSPGVYSNLIMGIDMGDTSNTTSLSGIFRTSTTSTINFIVNHLVPEGTALAMPGKVQEITRWLSDSSSEG